MPLYDYRNYRSPYTESLVSLIGRPGQIAAERARNSGQIKAGIANVASNTLGGLIQYQQDAPKREMQALQLDAARTQAQGVQQDATREQAITELLSRDKPPTQQEILAVAGPERGMSIVKGLDALFVDPKKAYTDRGTFLKTSLSFLEALPEAARAEAYGHVRPKLIESGAVTPEDLPEQYSTEGLAPILRFGEAAPKPNLQSVDPTRPVLDMNTGDEVRPGAPAAPKEVTFGVPQVQIVRGKRGLVRPGSDGKLYDTAGAVLGVDDVAPIPETATSAADNSPLQSIIGPDGKPVLVRRQDAIGKTPASGTSKPATGLEKRALNFYNRAHQADIDLEAMEPKIQALNLGGQAWMAVMPNFAQTQLGQQYTQAQRAFTEARLRKDSGAAIPEAEFDNDRKTYFAQPGDSKETLEQKRRGRAAVLASLGFESGQALGEFVGDTDEARAIVDGFKARSKKVVAPAAPKVNPF